MLAKQHVSHFARDSRTSNKRPAPPEEPREAILSRRNLAAYLTNVEKEEQNLRVAPLVAVSMIAAAPIFTSSGQSRGLHAVTYAVFCAQLTMYVAFSTWLQYHYYHARSRARESWKVQSNVPAHFPDGLGRTVRTTLPSNNIPVNSSA